MLFFLQNLLLFPEEFDDQFCSILDSLLVTRGVSALTKCLLHDVFERSKLLENSANAVR